MSDTQSQQEASQTQSPAPGAAPGDAEDLSPMEQNYEADKSYLQSTANSDGVNLFDHLVTCLRKILEERPKDVVDIFEDVSRQCKRTKVATEGEGVKIDRSTEIALAEIQKKLFAGGDADEEEAMGEEDGDTRLPNLMQAAFFFEQGAVGLDKEEFYRIWLSLKKLVDEKPIEKLRFWGKIFGTEQNYYVAEVEFREGEGEEEEAEEEAEAERDDKDDEEGEEEEAEDDTPKPMYKPAPPVPKEEPGAGANRFVYYVCHEPGKPWTRLPAVTPAQISGARKIKKFFTGRLDAAVTADPPFPGNEANFLRAQIARISAGTHVSPKDFYNFGEEEEEDEEGGGRDTCVENPEFESLPARALADADSWVHHVLHILPQGRTRWWNPSQLDEEEEIEDEDEEEKEEQARPQPEVGPPLLTPLSEDAPVDGMSPWSIRLSTGLMQQFAVAVVSSNLWPGAHAVASGKVCENIYIGWGHKFGAQNFTPAPAPSVQPEFLDDELKEADDPTPEEEAALKAAMLAEGEEGEEEGLGDEEDEEDD